MRTANVGEKSQRAGREAGALLNHFVQREIRFAGHTLNAFQVCGLFGLGVATGLAALLSLQRNLPLGPALALCPFAIVVFLTLAMATKIAVGREVLIYYHHEIAVFAASAVLLRASGLPVLAYLDIVAAGLGVFLAFGRIGCLCAGCCHGRPHSWGVEYGPHYIADGLDPEFVGRPLFPIQLGESLAVLTLTAAVALLTPGHPGALFTGYVAGYAAIRFVVEFYRGDRGRRHWLTFSEAQWTSAILAAVALSPRAPLAAVLPLALLGAGAIRSRRLRLRALVDPRHLRELATALDGPPRIVRSSLGIQLSVERTAYQNGLVTQYSLSQAGHPLAEREAQALSRAIASIDRTPPATGSTVRDLSHHWIRGANSVFHLLIQRPHNTEPAGGHS